MHIALCDSNMADRKQMERLLMRESDKRMHESGVFYIDTFGSPQALLHNPLVYDAYFLDVTDPVFTAYEIACHLCENGIVSPIIYCISTIDYHNSGTLLPNSVFLDKPILVNELSLVLDEIILQQTEHHVPRMEFRNNTETFYLEEQDFVYCTGEKYEITLHLASQTTREATAFLDNLWMELTPFPSLFLANKNTIVNARYVKEVAMFSVTLTTGEVIKITPGLKKEIKRLMNAVK